jgi:hypothetical protein
MMRPLPIVGFTLLAGFLLYAGLATSNSSGPINAVTGAPGEQNCSQCHGSASTNPSRFQISALGGVTNYAAGSRIQLRVEHLGAGVKNGFELTAVKGSARYGTLEVTDAANTQLSTAGGGNGKQYIKQRFAGTSRTSWDLAWNAPATLTDTASVNFYASGIQSNNNGNDDGGDVVFNARLNIPQQLTAVKERVITAESFSVYPNPCVKAVHLNVTLTKAAPIVARLYNTAGVVQQERTFYAEAGKQTVRWAFDTQPAAGLYIVRLSAGASTVARTLLVQ